MSTETYKFKDNFKTMFYGLMVLDIDKILLAKCWNEFIKIRPYVFPFARQPWVANGQIERKNGQKEGIEKHPFIFGEYTTKIKMANGESL
jgi:hypothetical protein